jgi:hypothetical protein
MLPVKKYNTGTNFYFPKNRNSFWVRDVMYAGQQNITTMPAREPYINIASFPKPTQNTLQE